MTGDAALDARIRFADDVQAAVDRAYAGVTPTARKLGRGADRPHVPALRYPDTSGHGHYSGGGRDGVEQILGLAYASRGEAVEAARRVLFNRQVGLTQKLTDPRHRALREYHGLPREIPS